MFKMKLMHVYYWQAGDFEILVGHMGIVECLTSSVDHQIELLEGAVALLKVLVHSDNPYSPNL